MTHGPAVIEKQIFCEHMCKAIKRIKPKLHVSGHFHAFYGTQTYDLGDTELLFVNAAFDGKNPPIWVEIENGKYTWG